MRARVVAAGTRSASPPAVGEVAVQIDSAGVLASPGPDAVGVDGVDHPQVDPADVAIGATKDSHDLMAFGLVPMDRADHERPARGVRVAEADRAKRVPAYRSSKGHTVPRNTALEGLRTRVRGDADRRRARA